MTTLAPSRSAFLVCDHAGLVINKFSDLRPLLRLPLFPLFPLFLFFSSSSFLLLLLLRIILFLLFFFFFFFFFFLIVDVITVKSRQFQAMPTADSPRLQQTLALITDY